VSSNFFFRSINRWIFFKLVVKSCHILLKWYLWEVVLKLWLRLFFTWANFLKLAWLVVLVIFQGWFIYFLFFLMEWNNIKPPFHSIISLSNSLLFNIYHSSKECSWVKIFLYPEVPILKLCCWDISKSFFPSLMNCYTRKILFLGNIFFLISFNVKKIPN